ncbi:MAG: hypothetical protein E7277_10005 [Lachnospiraceae bacterium]|nr:hypothetical protein [Lachnospiraceae bacterium]
MSYPIIKHWSAYESNRFITLKETLPTIQEEQSFSKAILLSSEILLRLFGYMFLCNSIITMLSSIKFLKTITILISPLLEVTTGLIGYVTAYDATKQIPYIFAVLNFGGLSGCLQVIPVLKKDNYSIKCYLFSKCILMVTTYIITKLLILFI